LNVTVVFTTGDAGDAVIFTSGSARLTVTGVFFDPIRPALSVVTRLTMNVCAVVKVCAEILFVGPGQSLAAPPGQCMTAVPSPKFQATSTIV
jgi:hypothetical protein